MRTNVTCSIFAGLGLVLAVQAHAETVTGSINSTLTLTAACQVNGSSGTSGLDFGTLDFGTTDALFGTANAQVFGSGGGALSVVCSSGTTPSIRVRAGANDGQSAGGTRALSDGNNNYVPYDFYTDAGRTQVLAIDGTINLPISTGEAQTVDLYGQARGKAGLPAGTYSDTVSVELTF
ncbi:spore coat U domain-containing protein [Pseudomonas sp. BP8]|uniref:Csu type fimbrial protein n=1 Tax=Pseudomonas sp. BP8 TaxID=2817864 RepID=UPI001AE31A69|nr:spore coat U domain-containing protein [Pseudomonas sp. BP8]MBP2263244.1 spore coat protein U-like protein [Pseudomonas sp. BP8]HDS1737484.1 spore coat protein U domain-containing protein [Pseudomonas putida]